MRSVQVLYKDQQAGILSQQDDGTYVFTYTNEWLADTDNPQISLTLPKRLAAYTADHLFPTFYHLLPEGTNRQLVCHYHNIDLDDDFSILATTANQDTIGAISVKQVELE